MEKLIASRHYETFASLVNECFLVSVPDHNQDDFAEIQQGLKILETKITHQDVESLKSLLDEFRGTDSFESVASSVCAGILNSCPPDLSSSSSLFKHDPQQHPSTTTMPETATPGKPPSWKK